MQTFAHIKWTRKHNKAVRIIRKTSNRNYVVQPWYYSEGGRWGEEITVPLSRFVPGSVKKCEEADFAR